MGSKLVVISGGMGGCGWVVVVVVIVRVQSITMMNNNSCPRYNVIHFKPTNWRKCWILKSMEGLQRCWGWDELKKRAWSFTCWTSNKALPSHSMSTEYLQTCHLENICSPQKDSFPFLLATLLFIISENRSYVASCPKLFIVLQIHGSCKYL